MILLVLTALVAVSGADKLDRTYLPPASAKTAGGSPGSLQPPLTGSFSEGLSLPKGSFTNDDQGVVVDAALSGTRSAADSEQSGLGGPRPSYGSMASKVGDAAFRGSQNFAIKPERPQAAKDRNSNILTYENNVDINNYNYGYETDNGIAVGENGVAQDGVQAQGGYSYKGDDGQVYSVTYTADKNGYKPQGSHLPTAPPIPDEILKSIEKNRKEEAAGVVDDGSYDAQKYNAEGDYAESDSYKYNGVQQSQFDRRPGSETTSNGAVINQNDLINGANAQNNMASLGPDGKPAKGIISLTLLGLLGSQIASTVAGEAGAGTTGGVGSVISGLLTAQRPEGFSLLDDSQNSTSNNEQTININEQPAVENTNTQLDSSSNPVSSRFGTPDQPIGTTGNNFAQSTQNGNLNNEYLPPYTSGQSAQPAYTGQSQNFATFGSNANKPFGSNTNKPFGSFGFSNQPGTGAGQSGSPAFGSQSAYGNQQQILPSSFGPQSIPSKANSGYQGAQSGSNYFGQFPQQPQPGYNLNPMKDSVESHATQSGNNQISSFPTQSQQSVSMTPQTQSGSAQYPSQTGQNVPLSGSRPQNFGSFNIQYRPSGSQVQQPQGQGQTSQTTGNNQQSSFTTGFTQNDAFGSQSSPASSQQIQGQRPFSGNKPGFNQNAFGTQPQYQTPTQQFNKPLSGGQVPQSFQNGFNQNNGFNAQRPTSTFGQQPSSQFGQTGFVNKPQSSQTGFLQNGAFSQNQPTSQLQGQNVFGQSSLQKKPQNSQNGFTQNAAFGQNKPTTSQQVQNQANQFNTGSKQPSQFPNQFSQNTFGKPTASNGPTQTSSTFGNQQFQPENKPTSFNNQPIVVQPQGADQSYYYNQPSKPFNSPSSAQPGAKAPSSQHSNSQTVDEIKFPSTEDLEEYANSTPKPEQSGSSQPIFNGVTQAAASPFPSKPTPSTQFGTFGKPQESAQKPQGFPQTGQQFSKPSTGQGINQNVNNQRPQMQDTINRDDSVQSGASFNPSNPEATQQYDGELYQYDKPEPVLAPETDQQSSSNDKTGDSQSQSQPQFDQTQDAQSPTETDSTFEASNPTNQPFGSTQQPPTSESQSQFATQPFKPFGSAPQLGSQPTKPQFGQTFPTFPTSQPSQPFGTQPFKPFGSASQFGAIPSKPQFGQILPASFPSSQPSQPQFGTQPLKPFGGSSQPNPAPGQPQFDQTTPASLPSSQPNRPQFPTQPFKPFNFKPFGSFSQPGSLPNKPQFDQTSGSFPSSQPNKPQFGTQPFKPFGSAPQPGAFPAKPQFGQILPSTFPTPQPVQQQFGTQPLKPLGQQTAPAFGSQLKPQGSETATPLFDQPQSNTPQISQPSQPSFGSPTTGIQTQSQFGNQGYKPFGQTPKPQFNLQSKPQFGQTQPAFSNNQQSQFGSQNYKPFGNQQPTFGSNQASLPTQQGQYNFQSQFPSPTKPQFGQTGAFTSNTQGTQAFRQQAKPFEPQSSFPLFNQGTQESQASSSATAKGPSATASAQASTGSEPEDQPRPAFKKPCCKVIQSAHTSPLSQGPKGEDFKGPEQPQTYDEKTGYHY